MNKYTVGLLAVVGFVAGITLVQAQSGRNSCGTIEAWQQANQIDPSLALKRQQAEIQIDNYLQALKNARITGNDSDSVRIIPVVFHIIHEGGPENISDAQVIDGLRVFNEDYRRQNKDTLNTYSAFRPVAADTKIIFRLATKDPNGNCTNGIDRIYSNRTNLFNDFAKSIIDWPSDKYLNIWVVNSIGLTSVEKGSYVIGYAHFPLTVLSALDGVVLANDFVGTIGTAAPTPFNNYSTYSGRDGTHEIGHYLDLIHTWGDAECGDDKCDDTPVQDSADFGCLQYPHITCGNNGDMTDNYMSYADGSCKDIFTRDQKARMRAALDVARFSIWQQSNLIATGTADPYIYPPSCAPKADFLMAKSGQSLYANHVNICPGSFVAFKLNTTNGTPAAWNWQFPGGTPSSSTDSIPGPIQYNNQGAYDVTLTVTNAQGSSTIDKQYSVNVDWGFGVKTVPFSEGFEETSPLPGEWKVNNDDGGPAWQRTNRASYSGSYSMSVQNFETFANTAPGSFKELISPSFDFTNVTNAVLSFRLSYGQQISITQASNYSNMLDSLSIDYSTNCGNTFLKGQELKHLAGNALAVGSGGFQPNDFAPASTDQWMLVSIPLSFTGANYNNVKFRFLYVTGFLSNNIYIDDINISGTVGISEETNDAFRFNVDPNPASESFNVSYTLKRQEDLTINLYDLQGRLIRQLESKHEYPGIHDSRIDGKSFNLATGVYILKMITPDGVISKKLVYSSN